MIKIMLVFAVFVVASTFGAQYEGEIESNFAHEETCPLGACVLEKECPHTVSQEEKGLCPNQRSSGAICCKNFPLEKLNCKQRHDECKSESDCPKFLRAGRRGCSDGKICCTLV